MKWWLIVYAFTVDGVTAFDLEYDSRAECTAALVRTYAINRERTEPRKLVAECNRFPLPVRQLEEPEIEI